MRAFPDSRGPSWRLMLSAALVATLPDGSVRAVERYDETDIFFELNATAGDVGVHVSLDAERWKSLQITDPRGRAILKMEPQGSAAGIGLTELFFEGEEPSLQQVPFRRLLKLFPPGRYKFEGTTREGETLRSKDTLSAQLPCPVRVVTPSPTAPTAADAVVISWETVPGVYDPDMAVCNFALDVGLVGFQVIAEAVNESAETTRSYVVDLPRDATSARVATEFLAPGVAVPGTEFRLEVIAIEDTGNKTITEANFQVNGGGGPGEGPPGEGPPGEGPPGDE